MASSKEEGDESVESGENSKGKEETFPEAIKGYLMRKNRNKSGTEDLPRKPLIIRIYLCQSGASTPGREGKV